MLTGLIAAAVAAFASSSDCTMPGPIGARICASAQTAPLVHELTIKEARVLQVTARPATWRARAVQFRTWLAQPDLDGKPPSDAALAQRIKDQLLELDNEIERASGLATAPTETTALSNRCQASWLAIDCRVTASGTLYGIDGARILWQRQSGASRADGIGSGIMLWEARSPGPPRLIGWSFEGVHYEAPRLSEDGRLWVPGSMAGSGNGNADLLYVLRDGQWVEIETTSWRDTLPARLPKGFGAWHGIDYDFMGMDGLSPLWRDADPNCCATGGSLTLRFSIRGTSLMLDDIDVDIVEKWARKKR